MRDNRDTVVRDQAGEPDIRIVQVGWQVNDKTGRHLGEVISRDGTSILVELEDGGGERVTIPTRLIAEEDESMMLVILAVDSSELEAVSSSSDLADEPTPLT